MSLYLLAEAGNLFMAGATMGSVFPGAAASPPILPTLPWSFPLENAPDPRRFTPPVATRSLPGLLGRDPLMRESGIGSEAMGLDSGAAEGIGPLTPGHDYILEGPLDQRMPVGSSLSSVTNSLSMGGQWHILSATSPNGAGFIIRATYTGAPIADASLQPGWILTPATGFEIASSVPAPPPPPAPTPSPIPAHILPFHPSFVPPPATQAQPPPQALPPPPQLQDRAPPPPITTMTTGGANGNTSGTATPWLVAGGVVLAFLYLGRKKKRGG